MDTEDGPSSHPSSKGNDEPSEADGDGMSRSSAERGEDLREDSATNSRAGNESEPSDNDETEQQEEEHVLGQGEREALMAEDAQLDLELHVIRKMRLAFEASLQMLEAVRDDLVEMGDRMDRLAAASKRCREALRNKKQRES
jgi:hypothetical protein